MMVPYWWIREIDWRISAGIIFFIQLMVWNCEEKKKHWLIRVFISFVTLCFGSWLMRYVLEEGISGKWLVALGYSFYIMVLSVLFILCYYFCYRVSSESVLFYSMIALTIYRVSWNAVKLISTIPVEGDAAWSNGSIFQSVMSYILYLVLAIAGYQVFRYFVKQPALFQVKLKGIFAIVLLCQMLLEFTFQLFYKGENLTLFFLTALLYSIFNYVLLVLLAFLNTLRQAKIGLENFISSKQKYYEISREGILSLQIKCHDLKHQIAMIRAADGERQMNQYIDNLADSIDEYNTVVSTGNKDVDVVLTEKNIICSMNRIRFTYIIDGMLFSFLKAMEIYALFGNVMDNAIESMSHVDGDQKKFISLKANRVGDMAVLVVENYFEHDLEFENGIPVTSKDEKGSHGFGLRSIISIAKDHGGGVVIQTEEHVFKLVVSMCLNEGL